ncbi:MAG TPA: DUF4386 family protein [Terracidiphilus sp.]|nr:DUF4386 family protein [Terracidiphilus sp.]
MANQTEVILDRRPSPGIWSRFAGAFYFLAVAVAVFCEFFAPGRYVIPAIVIPVACYAVVTLLLYAVLKPVHRGLALLAAIVNLIGLALEALRWQPSGINIAMLFHGSFCILIGWLILRSTFLPRVLGAFMAIAGLIWMIYLLPPLAGRLAPYNTVIGLLGETMPMLWLFAMGVNAQRWREQSIAR